MSIVRQAGLPARTPGSTSEIARSLKLREPWYLTDVLNAPVALVAAHTTNALDVDGRNIVRVQGSGVSDAGITLEGTLGVDETGPWVTLGAMNADGFAVFDGWFRLLRVNYGSAPTSGPTPVINLLIVRGDSQGFGG